MNEPGRPRVSPAAKLLGVLLYLLVVGVLLLGITGTVAGMVRLIRTAF